MCVMCMYACMCEREEKESDRLEIGELLVGETRRPPLSKRCPRLYSLCKLRTNKLRVTQHYPRLIAFHYYTCMHPHLPHPRVLPTRLQVNVTRNDRFRFDRAWLENSRLRLEKRLEKEAYIIFNLKFNYFKEISLIVILICLLYEVSKISSYLLILYKHVM